MRHNEVKHIPMGSLFFWHFNNSADENSVSFQLTISTFLSVNDRLDLKHHWLFSTPTKIGVAVWPSSLAVQYKIKFWNRREIQRFKAHDFCFTP